MQDIGTFLEVGWDYVGETANGTEDIWRMCVDGVSYPLLWFQFLDGDFICPDGVNFTDYIFLARHWLESNDSPNWNPLCDISDPKDGVIDLQDLGVFAGNWLTE
jgi:hypothetical protein